MPPNTSEEKACGDPTGSSPLVPTVISIGMRASVSGERWEWHTHPFDEICLFAGDGTTMGHGERQVRVGAGSVVLYMRGERHGFWNEHGQSPDLWVVHFDVAPVFYERVLPLHLLPPEKRLIILKPAQLDAFFGLFVKISLESAFPGQNSTSMASAWLQLLIASFGRWQGQTEDLPAVDARTGDAELLELWQVLSERIKAPFSEMERLPDLIPNYDSVRHRFKRTFGVSPRALLGRMRMQLAQNLLLEGKMSVKEVAHTVGYWRQHEFARAFRRHTGLSPVEWRRRPH
ncbi:helix-turn-helix domain-containing protein [soil metagenome]